MQKSVTCPECDHEFDPRERCWHVCNNCYTIIPEDEDHNDHKSGGNCIKRLGSYTRRYTEQGARELQAKKIRRRRGLAGET